MTIVTIPTRGDNVANYFQRINLDGQVFQLTFNYNDRDNSWYLSIADNSGIPIRDGIKLVPNYPLLELLVNERWTRGEMILFDERKIQAPPLLEELGVVTKLLYRTAG